LGIGIGVCDFGHRFGLSKDFGQSSESIGDTFVQLSALPALWSDRIKFIRRKASAMKKETRLRNRFRNDSGNPLQPGNALKNKNFDKVTFRILGISVAIVILLVAIVYLLLNGNPAQY
jgi:hypothetical protein